MDKKLVSIAVVIFIFSALFLIAAVTISATSSGSAEGAGEMSQYERDHLYEMKQHTRYLNEIANHLEKIARK